MAEGLNYLAGRWFQRGRRKAKVGMGWLRFGNYRGSRIIFKP